MALTNQGIQLVKEAMATFEDARLRMSAELETIIHALRNSDLDMWATETDVGKKWVEEFMVNINQLEQLSDDTFDLLKKSTNEFLDEQEQLNMS